MKKIITMLLILQVSSIFAVSATDVNSIKEYAVHSNKYQTKSYSNDYREYLQSRKKNGKKSGNNLGTDSVCPVCQPSTCNCPSTTSQASNCNCPTCPLVPDQASTLANLKTSYTIYTMLYSNVNPVLNFSVTSKDFNQLTFTYTFTDQNTGTTYSDVGFVNGTLYLFPIPLIEGGPNSTNIVSSWACYAGIEDNSNGNKLNAVCQIGGWDPSGTKVENYIGSFEAYAN